MANRPEEKLYQAILADYQESKSVAKTAEKMKVSQVKVRKVLITEGIWHSKTSDAVQEYLAQGMKTAEIASALNTTSKAIQQYLPYTRGFYKGETRTASAVKSEEYRKRKKAEEEKNAQQTAGKTKTADENSAEKKIQAKAAEKKTQAKAAEKKIQTKAAGNKSQTEPVKKEIVWPASIPGDFLRLRLELVEKDTVIQSRKSWAVNESRQSLELKRREKAELNRVLHSYGGVRFGANITRDLMIPADFSLAQLHGEIQKLFNWQDREEHSFLIAENSFAHVISDRAGNWAELCGILFDVENVEKIRKKSNFFRLEYSEDEEGKKHVESAKPEERMSYPDVTDRDRLRGIVEKEVVSFAKAPAKAIYSICEEPSRLVESLKVEEILSFGQAQDAQTAEEILYLYDKADEWCVRISGSIGCADLIAEERTTPELFGLADGQSDQPVLLSADGLSVLEEVGGLDGYVRFLRGIHPEEEAVYWKERMDEEKIPQKDRADYIPGNWGYDEPDTLDWAKELGWKNEP